MADNNRIFYPLQQIAFKKAGDVKYTAAGVAKGVQSAGGSTNLNTAPTFQLGQVNPYEMIEDVPDVDFTIGKQLDGNPLLFHLATYQAAAGGQLPTLIGRADVLCDIACAIYGESEGGALVGNTPGAVVECSGMGVNSLTYNFSLDDFFGEEVSLVGENRVWSASPAGVISGTFSNTDTPPGSGGVNRRENLIFAYDGASGLDVNGSVADPDATIVPQDIFGISTSGTNEDDGDKFGAHLSNITTSTSLNRTRLPELGRRGAYARFANFPAQVTTEYQITSVSGDQFSATEEGILGGGVQCATNGNTLDRTIRIATCEGTRIYTGTKNKLTSVGGGGGDTGGGNMTNTYTYQTYSDMTVMHSGDPNGSGAAWWADRGTYLVDK